MVTKQLQVGDVMYDFSVTTADGKTLTLSELLKEKKMVLLNFWYVDCKFCVAEFPALSAAYAQYKEKAEVIALDPFDSMADIKSFLTDNPLSFPAASCPDYIPDSFGIMAYPVSIVIDRYGVVRVIEKGAMDEAGFLDLFSKYAK